MAPQLETQVLKDKSRIALLDCLDEFHGRKLLVLDPSLAGPLSLVVSVKDLQSHGVDQWYKLSNNPLQLSSEVKQVLFLVRGDDVSMMTSIASQIHADEGNGIERSYVVILTPRQTHSAVQALKDSNVYANVVLRFVPLHVVMLEQDLFSMEMKGCYRQFHSEGDCGGMFSAALAFMHMQDLWGVVPSIYAVGSGAQFVAEQVIRMQRENKGEGGKSVEPEEVNIVAGVPPIPSFDNPEPKSRGGSPRHKASEVGSKLNVEAVVFLDRRVDLLSVFASMFTYEAMLNEIFGIANTNIEVPESLVSSTGGAKSTTIQLSSSDTVFGEVRDLHIDVLGPLLHTKATAIDAIYKEKDKLQSTVDIAEYMPKFKKVTAEHGSLTQHVNLLSHIREKTATQDHLLGLQMEDEVMSSDGSKMLEHIDDLIAEHKPIELVLRYMCLYSVINQGMKQKNFDTFRKAILKTYGFEHVHTLNRLQSGGLIHQRTSPSTTNWPKIKKTFNLLVDHEESTQDISYTYAGYAPLSVRLVQLLKSNPKGWNSSSIQEGLSLLWGPAIEMKQSKKQTASSDPPVWLIFYLGGVTYGEVAALRKLQEMEGNKRRFVIITTEMLRSQSFVSSMFPNFVPPSDEVEGLPSPEAASSSGFGLSGMGGWFGRK